MKKSLVGTKTREMYIQAFNNLTPEQKAEVAKSLAMGWKLKKAGKHYRKGGTKSLEQKNEEGSCPDQLLDKIEQLSKELGRPPSSKEFKQYYGGYLHSVLLTFGTWKNALNLLGMTTLSGGNKPKYTKQAIIKMFKDFKAIHGREPHISDVRDGLLPSQWTCEKYFGSWSKAKETAFNG